MTSDFRKLSAKGKGGFSVMKKKIALLMSLVLFLSAVMFSAPAPVAHAATRQELEAELSRIDQEISSNKTKLAELKDKKESQQEYLDTLENQISANEKKATNLKTQVETLDSEIDSLDKELKQLNTEIDVIKDEIVLANQQITTTTNSIKASKTQLSQKIRAAYVTGTDSNLKLIMGADSLASFLTRLEMMKRMSENDKKVIDKFKSEVTTLKKTKLTLEKKQNKLDEKQKEVAENKNERISRKAELKTTQAEYEKAVKELESDYAEVEAYIAELDKSSAVYETYIKNLESERAAADKEIESLIKNYQATTVATTQAERFIIQMTVGRGRSETFHAISAVLTEIEALQFPAGVSMAEWIFPLREFTESRFTLHAPERLLPRFGEQPVTEDTLSLTTETASQPFTVTVRSLLFRPVKPLQRVSISQMSEAPAIQPDRIFILKFAITAKNRIPQIMFQCHKISKGTALVAVPFF